MLARLATEVEQEASARSAELVASVRKEAEIAGIAVDVETVEEPWPIDPARAAQRGRTSDLNIIGLPRERLEDRWNVHTWLFGTGRPCLVHPNDRTSSFSLENVVIAWDLSKAAARATSDALPILKRAKTVSVVTVLGEKAMSPRLPAASLLDYLAAHNVDAIAREIGIEGKPVGRAILDDALEASADLLVMGAFGHSRLQEFVLGGASREVLDSTPIPLLMSH